MRVHPKGRKVYVVQTRADGKAAKRVTIGRHGVITAEEARRRAALVISRIKAGEDPVPEPPAVKLAEGPTVGELAERYLEQHSDLLLSTLRRTVEAMGGSLSLIARFPDLPPMELAGIAERVARD